MEYSCVLELQLRVLNDHNSIFTQRILLQCRRYSSFFLSLRLNLLLVLLSWQLWFVFTYSLIVTLFNELFPLQRACSVE